MNPLEMLISAGGGSAVNQIGSRFGLDQNQTMTALQSLLPALSEGMRRNTSTEGGVESLLGALSRGHHADYIDQPERLQDDASIQEGNGILGHLLGSREASRQVASEASAQTGIDTGILKQMLPLAATVLMGALSKQSSGLAAGANADMSSQGQGLMGMLTPMLDSNRDGSALDDVMGMVSRFMRR